MHLTILPLTLDTVQASAEVRRREGLLTNDSFVVAFMREQGLTQLATANGDFDRVSGIEIYKPADLEGQDTPANLSI
jgi:predicted nucleic acid-binding protein